MATAPKGIFDPQSALDGNGAAPSPGPLDQTGSDAMAAPHWSWLYNQYATASTGARSSDPSIDTEPARQETAAPSAADTGGAVAGDTPALASGGGGHASFESSPAPIGSFTSPETVTLTGSGMVFVNTYGAGVTDAFHTAIIAAENELQSHFTNPVTIRVSYNFADLGPGFLAQNNFFNTRQVSYTNLKAALIAHGTSIDDLAAIAALPLLAPSNSHSSSATTGFLIAAGMARILGLGAASNTLDDALVLGNGFTWNFDPNNRGAAGGFDAIGAIMHEISEGGMGRVGGLGFQNSTWAPLDLFRFTAAGVRDFTGGQDGVTTYFSPDGTSPDQTHPYHNSINSFGQFDRFDPGDWDVTGDSFGEGAPGDVGDLSATDLRVMDVLGWDLAPCFVRGTLIRTEGGEVPVEELAIGDRLVTMAGGAEPIRWIGRRAYDGRFIAGNRKILPVRVTAGALADGVPARDLWLSPQHALYIDGVLATAEHLVNGATIVQAESIDTLEYFNIEFDQQQVIFAAGAPAESYVDCDNRLMFANGRDYAALYPNDNRPKWQFCASRPERDAPEIAAIRAALLQRAGMLGCEATTDPALHLVVDGAVLRPHSVAGQVHQFAVPAGAKAVRLASRSAVPAETQPAGGDVRRLGVAVERIVLVDADLTVEVPHGHIGLCDGFHPAEATHRWTDGCGRLPQSLLRLFPAGFTLRLQRAETALAYPLSPPAQPRFAAAG
jgi:hypothetical protein